MMPFPPPFPGVQPPAAGNGAIPGMRPPGYPQQQPQYPQQQPQYQPQQPQFLQPPQPPNQQQQPPFHSQPQQLPPQQPQFPNFQPPVQNGAPPSLQPPAPGNGAIPGMQPLGQLTYPQQQPQYQQQQPQYQQQQQQHYPQQQPQYQNQYGGFPGMQAPAQEKRYVDLMQERNILGYPFENNNFILPENICNVEARMNSQVFRTTVTAIPESQEMLKKTRIPLGLTCHPFRDMKNLMVIQTSIVRCRYCRTYINPFVILPDHRHWKCNLCFRANDLPDDFCFDPVAKEYGDPRNRPELQHTTMEYIAPQEYMLRPPQPACYFYIFDISRAAIDAGYLYTFSEQLAQNLDRIPGDDRTRIGFLAFDSCLHFFDFFDPNLPPRELIISEVDEPFIPVPVGLLVNLEEFRESIRSFVNRLPTIFDTNHVEGNCLGTALEMAQKILAPVGGRISLLTCTRPSLGRGALKPMDLQAKPGLTPTSDFYKRLALECTSQQIGIDLFAFSTEYIDLATLADAVKFSSGTVYHFPGYHFTRHPLEVVRFKKLFVRYLTRRIGFEAVLRIRCSKGLALQNFHGNFFVRSTDLLAVANVSPDSSLSVQIQYEEDLTNQSTASFQAALLYTSSKGDRRIRVHTVCIPITKDIPNIFSSFDTKASVGLLSKMAAERALLGNDGSDVREALLNGVIDTLSAYNRSIGLRPGALCAPISGQLKFYPLFVLGLLKHPAFNGRVKLNLDELAAALLFIKAASLEAILNQVYPILYPIHQLDQAPEVQRLSLSYERINKDGVYLLDAGKVLLIYVCSHIRPEHLVNLFGVNRYGDLVEDAPFENLPNEHSDRVHSLIKSLNSKRCHFAPVIVVREDGQRKSWFISKLVDDRSESAHSYIEFIQHVTREVQR